MSIVCSCGGNHSGIVGFDGPGNGHAATCPVRIGSVASQSYRTIVADPPWHYGRTMIVTGNNAGRPGHYKPSGVKYPTMSINDIAALPVGGLCDPDGADLYLWTTNTHVEYAWRIARAWGFTPKNLLTWCKAPKGMIGFGRFSQSSEFVLFAERGHPAGDGRSERTWWEWKRREHSAKPEAFLDMVERLSPAPRLEMFSRRARLGWDTWGDEALHGTELTA